jgi:hypothetical protein
MTEAVTQLRSTSGCWISTTSTVTVTSFKKHLA